ncbi:MAG: hypothetical protein E7510_07340 [Ruminococcus sp.]|nr:hypothetical protein [Ruminococcus sp.]
MKIAKYFVSTILFLIFFFTLLIFNSSYIVSNPHNNNVRIESDGEVDMSLISQLATKNDITIYQPRLYTSSLEKLFIIYYVSNEDYDKFTQLTGIKKGYYDNPISDSVKVNLIDLTELKPKDNEGRYHILSDSNEKTISFITDVSKINGYKSFITYASWKDTIIYYLPYLIFIISTIIILIFTYMEATFKKKEILIRYTQGESFFKTIFINIFCDFIFYTSSFFIAFKALKNYTEICGIFKNISLFIIIFLLFNSIIYLCTFRINSKEIIYGHQYSLKMVSTLNFIKSFSSVFTFVVISFTIIISPRLRGFDKVSDILGDKTNYYFVNISNDVPKYLKDDPNKQKEFFYKQAEKIDKMMYETDDILEPIYIMDETIDGDDKGFNPVYCNHRALPYIIKMIPELENVNISDNDCVIILPENMDEKTKSNAKNTLLEKFKSYEGFYPDENKVQILYYKNSYEVLSFNNLHEFKYHISPCICIASDTTVSPYFDLNKMNHHYMLSYPIMKANSAEELTEVFSEYGFKAACSTVFEVYNKEYKFYKLILNLTKIVTILMSTFQVIVILILAKLEYRINATEFAVKKILGYSILQINKNQFKNIFATLILNLIIATIFIICTKSNIKILLVAFIIFLVESTILYFEIKHEDKNNLVKTLKGGAL